MAELSNYCKSFDGIGQVLKRRIRCIEDFELRFVDDVGAGDMIAAGLRDCNSGC